MHDGYRRLNNALVTLAHAAERMVESRTDSLPQFAAAVSELDSADLTPLSDPMREELLATVGALRAVQRRAAFKLRHPGAVQVSPSAGDEQRAIAALRHVQRYCGEMARRGVSGANDAPAEMDTMPGEEWSGFHSPAEWRKAWGCSESTWREHRDAMTCDPHPVSGARRVRFLRTDMQRLGLAEPRAQV